MGISQYSMSDVSWRLTGAVGSNSARKAENSTSRENNTELSMTDFLQLMIVQLQSQTLDDTMDTSEMLNQMVQMQMVTALTNMTETNIMTYASSLVGKEVTIGIINGDTLEEHVVEVTGTGYSNGQYVIFGKDEEGNVGTYNLSQIMAVGKLPPIEDEGGTTTKPGTSTPGTTPPGDTTEKPDDSAQKPDEVPDESVKDPGETGETENGTDTGSGDAEYDGVQGVPGSEP